VLPLEAPSVVLQQAASYNAVPSILGTNRDEAKLFQLFQSDAVGKLFGIPLWLEDADRYDAETQYPSQMWKARGVDEPAAAMRMAQGPTVFGYRFDWDEEPSLLAADFSRMLGAAHAFEIPFVFGHLSFGPASRFVFDEDKREMNERLSRQMMSYWGQFAYTGDPSRGRRGDQPHWRAWNPAPDSIDKFIVFDVEGDGGVRMSGDVVSRQQIIADVLDDERLEGWDDRCAVLRGFVLFSRTMIAERYATIADGACRRWPLDEAEG
jgi:para-nitrobenzyl esterase